MSAEPPLTAAESLDVLLGRLGAGPEAAPEYERLRLRLLVFFRYKVPAEAEALADQAIDRLAQRLSEGTPIQNLGAYALGIARLLVFEAAARERKERRAAIEALQQNEFDTSVEDMTPAVDALRRCLAALASEEAALILDYYAADSGAARIAQRQVLARRLGISLNTLRNRALRIRLSLERCLRRDISLNSDTQA